MCRRIFIYMLWVFILPLATMAIENADITVAQDGSGDYTAIQDAINSIPRNNSSLKIILIKNGVYEEEIRIDADFITLVGEDRDKTRIEKFKPYVWDSTYVEFGRAVVNIYADDVTLANLTVENTQPDVGIHAFAVFGSGNTRTIIINCNILSNGGDTLSLWNGDSGMYYHNTLRLKGAVDFLCPRGWCYADNIEFYCTRWTTPLWHDGSKNKDQKFVVKNSTFDGATTFDLGRNHLDGAFYLINLEFSEKLNDKDWVQPSSAEGPYKWGRRYYYHNCQRPTGNYDWFKNNMITAEGSPTPEEVTAEWTFAGKWDPEATLPSVLPMSFMPKPDNKSIRVDLQPTLTWVPGRNAQSHRLYFGAGNPPEFITETAERSYNPGQLDANTVYYWRIDEVNEEEIIEGQVWQFRTKVDHTPKKASQPDPADGAVDVESPLEQLVWAADPIETELQHFYFGEHPDSLKLLSSYSVHGYYLDPLYFGRTYYWRVDLENHIGLMPGDLWQFTMYGSESDHADYLQQQDEDGIVSIEVEHYSDSTIIGQHAWVPVTQPAGYSGSGAMQLLPDVGDFAYTGYAEKCSRLDFSVDFIILGTHYIWIRGYSQIAGDNMVHIGLNGGEEETGSRIGSLRAMSGEWEWLNVTATPAQDIRSFEVKGLGIQTVSLWYGRDGAIVDKIVLTTNPDFVPIGLGPDATVGVLERTESFPPEGYLLHQNYPNPANPSTTIKFTLAERSNIRLGIFNLRGREIAVLANGVYASGTHDVKWYGTDSKSHPVGSGLYMARLKTDDLVLNMKMLLLK